MDARLCRLGSVHMRAKVSVRRILFGKCILTSSMFAQYYCSRRWALPAYGLGLLIILLWLLNSWIDLQMNAWTGAFYDELQAAFSAANASKALKEEELTEVESSYSSLIKLWLFLSIPKVTVSPVVNLLTRVWAFQWRQAITLDYLYRWRIVSKARFELESISQRVQDDAYKLTRGIDSLVQGVLIALLQVITFLPLLWSLTSSLPGLAGKLVPINLGVALSGIAISSVVGRYLISLEYNNQAVEAAFRKELVYAEDGAEGFGLLATCHRLFYTLRANYYTLFLHLIYFEFWQALFNRCEECARRAAPAPRSPTPPRPAPSAAAATVTPVDARLRLRCPASPGWSRC